MVSAVNYRKTQADDKNLQLKLTDHGEDLFSIPPLTGKQRRRLQESLAGRFCPCPCGRPLADCFGCSMAKSEYSEAERLVRKGLSSREVKLDLDPPVVILVWFDYTDPEGRSLLRLLDHLKQLYGRSLRVHRRYFPTDIDHLEGWRETTTAIEIARATGLYEAAHRFFIQDDGQGWKEKIRRLPELLGMDRKDFERELALSRYESQIRKDLTAAPVQYGVRESPALEVDGEAYKGKLKLDSLSDLVNSIIIKKSL